MITSRFHFFILSLLLLTPFQFGNADTLIEAHSRDDVIQRGLFIAAEDATHTVLLFPGGNGFVKLKEDGTIRKLNGNFLLRTRDLLLNAGINVVIVDAPTDHYDKQGMSGGFRNSTEHMTDLRALITKVKQRSDKPIWLSGTSRGSESVAYAGIYLKNINGIILTSSITELNAKGNEITSYALDKITVPVFIGAHKEDGCWLTPPEGAQAIKAQLTSATSIAYKLYSGGDEPLSNPCKAKSQHGFLGIEYKVLMDMIKFIKDN